MTMKKLGMSAVVASMLTTAVYASGTISVEGGPITAATEFLDNSAVDVNLTRSFLYTNGMTLATASEAGFELKFDVTPTSDGNLTVQDFDTNETVADFDRVDGNSIIFSAATNANIQRNKKYKVVSDDNTTVGAGAISLTIPKGTTTLTATLIVSDNTGVNVLDNPSANVIDIKPQLSGSFSTKLNAQIDAANGFLVFATNSPTTTSDTYSYIYSSIRDMDIPVTVTAVDYVVSSDTNLSTYTVTQANTSATTTGAWGNGDFTNTVNDTNITMAASAGNQDNNGSIEQLVTLNIAPTAAMKVVDFKATGKATYTAGAVTGVTKTLFADVDAGTWTIFGYNAQIPNVAGLTTHDTTMKFTNRSSLDTNIYFTLIDPDGTVATLNSVDNPTVAALPSNTTGTYKASKLLALVTDTAFNKTGSVSVEVSIPTTPSAVYGMASFKNITLGQFKDLPVYNSSTLGY